MVSHWKLWFNYGKLNILNAELIGRDGELMVTMGSYGLLVI